MVKWGRRITTRRGERRNQRNGDVGEKRKGRKRGGKKSEEWRRENEEKGRKGREEKSEEWRSGEEERG